MPANETANRLAAAAWIQCRPSSVDDPILAIRSQVSCQNRLIVPGHLDGAASYFYQSPLIILPLDRTLTRRETTVHAQLLSTIGELDRQAYPTTWWVDRAFGGEGGEPPAATAPDTRLLIMPMHLDWIGDPGNPSWLPFVDEQNGVIPAGFDLDLYNAVAFLMPSAAEAVGETFYPLPADISVVIFQHPPLPEGDVTTIDATLYVQGEA